MRKVLDIDIRSHFASSGRSSDGDDHGGQMHQAGHQMDLETTAAASCCGGNTCCDGVPGAYHHCQHSEGSLATLLGLVVVHQYGPHYPRSLPQRIPPCPYGSPLQWVDRRTYGLFALFQEDQKCAERWQILTDYLTKPDTEPWCVVYCEDCELLSDDEASAASPTQPDSVLAPSTDAFHAVWRARCEGKT